VAHDCVLTMANSKSYELAVIGCGAMGSGMASSLIEAGAIPAEQIIAADIDEARRKAMQELGVATSDGASEVVSDAATILLAIKPQVLDEVLADIAGRVGDRLVITIAAGVPIARYEAMLGKRTSIVRVMPSILCTVGEAASAYCANAACSSEQVARVAELLNAVGTAVAVREELMDAVTGLSGSGPAFVAVFVEALIDGGVAAGLSRDQAARLAAQTVLGTGRWLQESGCSPSALKDMVTSPAGTTIAGIKALEEGGLRAAVIEAVVAAAKRSRELGS